MTGGGGPICTHKKMWPRVAGCRSIRVARSSTLAPARTVPSSSTRTTSSTSGEAFAAQQWLPCALRLPGVLTLRAPQWDAVQVLHRRREAPPGRGGRHYALRGAIEKSGPCEKSRLCGSWPEPRAPRRLIQDDMSEGKFYHTTKTRVEAYFKDNKARTKEHFSAARILRAASSRLRGLPKSDLPCRTPPAARPADAPGNVHKVGLHSDHAPRVVLLLLLRHHELRGEYAVWIRPSAGPGTLASRSGPALT